MCDTDPDPRDVWTRRTFKILVFTVPLHFWILREINGYRSRRDYEILDVHATALLLRMDDFRFWEIIITMIKIFTRETGGWSVDLIKNSRKINFNSDDSWKRCEHNKILLYVLSKGSDRPLCVSGGTCILRLSPARFLSPQRSPNYVHRCVFIFSPETHSKQPPCTLLLCKKKLITFAANRGGAIFRSTSRY